MDGASEILTANVSGTSISTSYLAGVLTLTGSDTVQNYEQVLRTITYQNNSDTPNTVARIISVTVSDGTFTSNAATSTLNVVATNDAPVLSTNQGIAVAEGSINTVIGNSRLQVSDVDNTATQLVYTLSAIPSNGTVKLWIQCGHRHFEFNRILRGRSGHTGDTLLPASSGDTTSVDY